MDSKFTMWCKKIYDRHFYVGKNECIYSSSTSFRFGNSVISAIRISCIIFKKEFPKYKFRPVRVCENSYCYNPKHLLLTDIEKFWFQVNKTESCWNWKASKDGGGYGICVTHKYGRDKAHRISYKEFYGRIPEGMFVCHTCDNPACVNPQHLFLGTNQDNINDKVIKNRQSRLYGKANGRATMSKESVIALRDDYSSGKYSYRDLVIKYGIKQTQVARIIKRESWSWV